jgi:hypothetical protein
MQVDLIPRIEKGQDEGSPLRAGKMISAAYKRLL